jgi:hypothetical protein
MVRVVSLVVQPSRGISDCRFLRFNRTFVALKVPGRRAELHRAELGQVMREALPKETAGTALAENNSFVFADSFEMRYVLVHSFTILLPS